MRCDLEQNQRHFPSGAEQRLEDRDQRRVSGGSKQRHRGGRFGKQGRAARQRPSSKLLRVADVAAAVRCLDCTKDRQCNQSRQGREQSHMPIATHNSTLR